MQRRPVRRPPVRVLLGAVAVAAFLGVIAAGWDDLDDALHRLKGADALLVAAALLLEAVAICGYVTALHAVFGPGVSPLTWLMSWHVSFAGFAATRIVSAGGAGAVGVTVWTMHRLGLQGADIARRMVRLLAVTYTLFLAAVIVAAGGIALEIWAGGLPRPIAALATGVAAIVAGIGFALAARPAAVAGALHASSTRAGRHGPAVRRLAATATQAAAGLSDALGDLRRLRTVVVGAALWWSAEVAVLGAAFAATGDVPPVALLVCGYFLGTLGNLLPMPGGVGGVEGGMIAVFVASGLAAQAAVAAVVLYRVANFWLPTLPAVVAFLTLRGRVDALGRPADASA